MFIRYRDSEAEYCIGFFREQRRRTKNNVAAKLGKSSKSIGLTQSQYHYESKWNQLIHEHMVNFNYQMGRDGVATATACRQKRLLPVHNDRLQRPEFLELLVQADCYLTLFPTTIVSLLSSGFYFSAAKKFNQIVLSTMSLTRLYSHWLNIGFYSRFTLPLHTTKQTSTRLLVAARSTDNCDGPMVCGDLFYL